MAVSFLNIKIDTITKQESFALVEKFVLSNKYHYQISVNVAKLVYAQKDVKLLNAINNADIINSDGMPIKVLAQMKSKKKVTRMGGWDYIEGLAKEYPEWNYYFWGATQEVLDKVVQRYKEKYGLNIVGSRNGYFSEKEIPGIVEDINSKKTNILFIAIGTPAKEYLLYDLKDKLKCNFAVGVGGAFDIIAGKTKRAPLWIQNIGMEWMYRIYQEPRRMWKRYAKTNILFLYLLTKELLRSGNR